jgi:hypothetical protein
MKNSVKTMRRNGNGFQYLQQMLPRISDAKMKEGVFVGPQMKKLTSDRNFDAVLEVTTKRAWEH